MRQKPFRLFSRAALALLMMLLTTTTAWAQFSSGNGTEGDPYKISKVTDLTTLYSLVNGGETYEDKYFVQTIDLDMSIAAVWTDYQGGGGIGKDTSHPFMGHYNGAGFKISGLRVSTTGQYAGLFGYIKGSQYNGPYDTHVAEVHDVVLVNPSITITPGSASKAYAGAVVGYAGDNARIYDCTVIGGTVTYSGVSSPCSFLKDFYAGGIVGYYGASNIYRLSGNKVSATTTVSGGNICGGIAGYLSKNNAIYNNVADATVSATKTRYSTGQTTEDYCQGAIAGYVSSKYSQSPNLNYYHAAGLTAYGKTVGHPFVTVADGNDAAHIYTVTLPSGLSLTGDATATIGTARYYIAGATVSLTVEDADKAIKTLTATGAASSSVAANKKSATVTLGTSDATVSTTLQAISGTTADGLTWSLTQNGNDGGYTVLTISGSGAMQDYNAIQTGRPWCTDAPWGNGLTSVTINNGVTSIGRYAFIGCQSLERIVIQHDGAVALGSNAFQNCDALQYIVFPSIAAEQANTTGNWSGLVAKHRAKFGNQHFGLTTVDNKVVYAIATETDLRNLASAVNEGNTGSGNTFRQTAPIDLTSGGNFPMIGRDTNPNTHFRGTYDGGGYTISGLTASINHRYVGLFAIVNGGTVRDVILVSPSVTSTYEFNQYHSVGALVGLLTNGSTVENCHAISSNVNSTGNGEKYLGTLIGLTSYNATITNCYYYGSNQNQIIGDVLDNSVTVTRVSAAHLVTPATGVNIQTEMAADLGFTYDGKNYWRTGAELALADLPTDTPAQYYRYAYTYGSTVLSGTSLTVADQDRTVSISQQPVDWACEGNSGDDAQHAYMIYTKDQLLLLAYRVNGTHGETADKFSGKFFKLGTNIEFDPDDLTLDGGQSNYEAIGGYHNGDWQYFGGDFDGDGYTISGIRINKIYQELSSYDQGLFGQVKGDANIHDVHLIDAHIKGLGNVGGIVGDIVYSTVSGCTVTESTITSTTYKDCGTICGESLNGTTFRNNYYHGCTVNGTAVTSGVGCKDADIIANDGAVPVPALSGNTDNSTVLGVLNSVPNLDIALSDRTLYKDGYWNTLVLPFDVTIASSPLAGDNVVAKVLSTTSKLDNGTLTLNFSDAPATIPAGTPFIIKWDNTGVNLVNPVFTGVTIDNTNRDVNFTDGSGSFKGTYAPLEITDANRSKVLLLSGSNKLGYAKTDRTIANGKALGTCRAYFYFPGSQTARSFVMNFDEDETQTTGIVHTEITESTDKAGAIYDLQGRRVEKTKKGLYIVNGKKVVVH